MNPSNLIPANHQGKQVDLSEQKMFGNEQAARDGFALAMERLRHPGLWKELCGKGSASFMVTEGTEGITKGGHIRIDIPGPGSVNGNGYDWVKVEMMEKQEGDDGQLFGIKLVPCADPGDKTAEPAHFFSDASSSTLIVERKELTVHASYHGRNEVANNKTGHPVEDIRNTLIAAGALAGLSELQWKKLLRGLLESEER
jgi:hypothetical protein